MIVQLVLLTLGSCSRGDDGFVIGVSQCSEDLWRETVNREIMREASFRSNMEVVVRSVKDDSRQQIRDIERFIAEGVDLLVIAPNEASALTPVVSKAYNSGIPVILLDRKILNDDYTAYVGADNYKLAHQLGLYAAAQMNYEGNVVEIRGLNGSTADAERHRGFTEAIAQFPRIQIIAEAEGNFLRNNAREKMHSILNEIDRKQVDLIFAMNDQMALGVNDATRMYYSGKRPYIIGIDALLGKGGGMEAINDGAIDASFIYPTGGDRVIELAYRILNGIKYERENILSTGVVDRSNVRVITLQNEQIIAQQDKVETLNSRLNRSATLYTRQSRSLLIAIVFTIFAVSTLLVLIRTNNSKNKLNRQLNLQNEEIKRQVDTLQTQKVQLVKLSRELEAATQAKLVFFTDISHDLKTPLTLIMGPVEELLTSENLSEGERESLKLIQRNSHKLMGLLTQILEFRTYENGKMQMDYSLGAMDRFLDGINQLFTKFIHHKQVDFSFETDGSDLTFPFDAQKMEKIYFNLLSNAFKFVMPGGSISVRLKRVIVKNRLYCELSVYNSDSYIHPDHVKSGFERFYHLGDKSSGSGIGLALTKSLVRMHGGTIGVESDEKDGTTFIVTIPMPNAAAVALKTKEDYGGISSYCRGQIDAIAPPQEHEKESILEDVEAGDKPVVLLIEDNPDMCTYAKNLLAGEYLVVTAPDGKEGVKMAVKYLPSIILSDVMMPGMSGFEVCRDLKNRELTKDIPVVMLTACGMDEQRIEGFESGADAYISKPFNADILKVRMGKLIENRKNIKRLIDHEWLTGKECKTLAESHRELLGNFRKYVETHIQEEIDIDDLAADLGMSRSKFYRKFNEITDRPPTEMINMIRLKRAANLLLYDRKSISEAAYESGFSSPSYFTKTFTRYYKQRPSDYLKSHSATPPPTPYS